MRSICSALLCLAACGKSDAPKQPASSSGSAPRASDATAAIDATVAAADAGVPDAPREAKIAEVVLRHGRACARRDDGRVRCWGQRFGETRRPGSAVPVEIPGLANAADIDVAFDTLYVVTSDGAALQTFLHDMTRIPPPKPIGKGTRDAIAIIERHVLVRDGRVLEFGTRDDGGGKKRWVDFEPVPFLTDVVELRPNLARHRDGTITAWWGADRHEKIDGLTKAVALGGADTARLEDGSWLDLDTDFNRRARPQPLDDVPRGATAVVLEGRSRCALVAGTISCTGRNDLGQLGSGEAALERTTYAKVELPAPATAIAAHDGSRCAILDTGALACWGNNTNGQLGDGTIIDRDRPVIVDGATSQTPPPYTDGLDRSAGSKQPMRWDDLPKRCTRPSEVPDNGGKPWFTAVSAYAYTKPHETDILIADFDLEPAGYNYGRMPTRGKQKAIVLGLVHGTERRPLPLARGRYSSTAKETAPRRAGMSEYTGPANRWAPNTKVTIDVTHLDRVWICGTYTLESDPEQDEDEPVIKPVTRPFAARLAKDPW